MTAMRCPKIKELKEAPFVGSLLGDILESAGVTDDDLPDMIRDDVDYTNRAELERDMPLVFAKLSKMHGETL